MPWPQDAYSTVAKHFVASTTMKCEPAVKSSLVDFLTAAHLEADSEAKTFFGMFRRHVYTTPKLFLLYLEAYREIYEDRVQQTETHIQASHAPLKSSLKSPVS